MLKVTKKTKRLLNQHLDDLHEVNDRVLTLLNDIVVEAEINDELSLHVAASNLQDIGLEIEERILSLIKRSQ